MEWVPDGAIDFAQGVARGIPSSQGDPFHQVGCHICFIITNTPYNGKISKFSIDISIHCRLLMQAKRPFAVLDEVKVTDA